MFPPCVHARRQNGVFTAGCSAAQFDYFFQNSRAEPQNALGVIPRVNILNVLVGYSEPTHNSIIAQKAQKVNNAHA